MKKVYVGGAFASVAAIIATWMAIGLGGTPDTTACPYPAFPDATCTGIPDGTILTTPTLDEDGNLKLDTPGVVIDSVQVENCILVNQPGITIRNSQAACIYIDDTKPSYDPDNDPLIIEDSTVNCGQTAGTNPSNTGISGQNFIARRLDITDCENGCSIGDHVELRDNFIHNLYNSAIGDPHTDGCQVYDGDNVTIEHNTIYGFSDGCVYPGGMGCNGTSSIIYNNVPAASAIDPPMENVLIRHNLFAGGAVSLYCPRQAVENFVINGNSFSTIYSPNVGEFGPSTSCDPAGNLSDGGDPGGETQIGNIKVNAALDVLQNPITLP